MRASQTFIIIVIACFLLVPVQNSSTAVVLENSKATTAQSDFVRIGTIEGIVTQIDPSGTVKNSIGSMQNASYYGYDFAEEFKQLVKKQMDEEVSYVAASQFEFAQRTINPNGMVSGPMASLTLKINPIIVLPENESDIHVLEANLSEAIAISEEYVSLYEEHLGIELHRLMTYSNPQRIYYYMNETVSISQYAESYITQYAAIFDHDEGIATGTAMTERLSNLGGYMDLLQAGDWPIERSAFSESLYYDHDYPYYLPPYYLNPYFMINSINAAFLRTYPAHEHYTENVNTGVVGVAGFDSVGYLQDSPGNETYSLKQHIGYSGNIESKMFQDSSVNAVSFISGITPSVLDISGQPSAWGFADKDFTFNSTSSIYTPIGIFPGDYTIDEMLESFLVEYPMMQAYWLNQSISYNIQEGMFDYWINNIWGGSGPFEDYRNLLLEYDWSEHYYFKYQTVKEVNQDLLRLIMENAGINPTSLMNRVNETLLEENPLQAIFEAFIEHLDSYQLLDILRNDTYSNPYVLEGMLNEYISNIEEFLQEFAGIDLPSSYTTKEAIAELVEEHFGLFLQGVFDAMADYVGNPTEIRNAVNALLNSTHIASETVPYLMMDLHSSLISEYAYAMAINFELPVYSSTYSHEEPYDPELLWMNSDDIVLEFDLDITSNEYEGPHLVIEKNLNTLSIHVEEDIVISLKVKNIGTATAYDIKILDGVASGFDSDKRYYWNRASLAAGEEWNLSVNITAKELGKWREVPAILCYFNTTLESFGETNLEEWEGTAYYTASTTGPDIVVNEKIATTTTTTTNNTDTDTDENWWEEDPMAFIAIVTTIASVGVVIVIVILVIRKR